MLQEDRLIFNESIIDYAKKRMHFIENRMENNNWDYSITLTPKTRNGKTYLAKVNLHINKQNFKSYPSSEYKVNLKEEVIPETEKTISTKKYTYEIVNQNVKNDFVRFDYYPYLQYPHFHINANENKWGNHLTYPETINLDLSLLDSLKALNIFEKFQHHPGKHILDPKENDIYVQILQ